MGRSSTIMTRMVTIGMQVGFRSSGYREWSLVREGLGSRGLRRDLMTHTLTLTHTHKHTRTHIRTHTHSH